ncbi:AraC family transcriptional regulator [Halospina denitrificans]|uniref:AraC family transcriptional regulator n=1 Tax=Halospina denitrificans TaxID=332522 RepID=UPI0014150BA9|nr:helix-turn-helix transcriptional regulator [Halospina denitrificans]
MGSLVRDPRIRELADEPSGGDGCLATLVSGPARVGYVTCGQPVMAEFWNEDFFGCVIPLRGRARLEQYPAAVQGRNGPFFLLPKSDQTWQFSADCELLVLRFSVESEGVRRRIQDVLQSEDGKGLADCAQVLMESIPYRLHHGLGYTAKLRLLERIRGEFLQLFGIDPEERAAPSGPEVMDPRVLRAMDYLLQLPASEYHLDAVCDVAHMSARGLYYAFERNLDCTPYAYFRACHLIRVRLALLRDTERRHSIAWHASTYGFQHMSRFAAHYRNYFGELPSETCQRLERDFTCHC